MARTDVFTMRDASCNAFLFSEVGTELNGSALTILSMLARLGQDPWAQAAAWAQLSKEAVIERLTTSIRRMPLTAGALSEAPATAARLSLLLLPQAAPATAMATATAVKAGFTSFPKWLRVALCFATLGCGLAANYFILSPKTPAIETLSPSLEPAAPG